MTNEQKAKIIDMRKEGDAYLLISQKTGLSVNTVSSYCRRNGLCKESVEKAKNCKQCGKPIKRIQKRKPRKFCSNRCRIKWWNSHPDSVNRKAVYHFTCAYCGQPFSAYGNSNRKYCSHACYIADRFQKDISK